MKSKKPPYKHSPRKAMPPTEDQIDADRLAAEAWARENAVKKLPPDSAMNSMPSPFETRSKRR